jgi:hypothetical protein
MRAYVRSDTAVSEFVDTDTCKFVFREFVPNASLLSVTDIYVQSMQPLDIEALIVNLQERLKPVVAIRKTRHRVSWLTINEYSTEAALDAPLSWPKKQRLSYFKQKTI